MSRHFIHKQLKNILLVVPLFLLSAIAHAQYNDAMDSASKLSEDLLDTTIAIDPEEIVDEEEYDDEELKVNNSVFFLTKDMQANGGGPDSLNNSKLPDSAIASLKKDDAFWYVDYEFEKQKRQLQNASAQRTPFIQTKIFQTLLWLLIIGGFAAFVIIYLSNSNVGLFRRRNTVISGQGEEVVETDNIFEIDYDREIDRAVANNNFRFAIRLMFLRLLKNMSDKKLIDYKTDRTDLDYLMQLYSTKHYHDFFRLTRNYEYSWYGQFEIDPAKFALMRSDFENFERKLR